MLMSEIHVSSSVKKLKKCEVCGDKAVGMNYNGLTCVSCRTFFARSATKIGVLKCPKLGDCEIDASTRKACGFCRLKKCFVIGMKLKNLNFNMNHTFTDQSSTQVHSSSDNSSDSSDSTIIPYSPSSSSRSPSSSTKSTTTNLDRLLHREISSILTSLVIDNNPIIEHLQPEKLHLSPLHRKRHYALDLNFREREIIAELQHAMGHFVEELALPEVRSTSDIIEVLSWPKVYSRRIISFCKSIRAFRSLKDEDQLAILKPFYYQLLVVRSVFMYDVDRNGYPVMEDEVGQRSVFICLGDPGFEKASKEWPKIKQENGNFFVSLQTEMENDPTLRDLIVGHFFYKPRTGISCPEFIRQQYFLYTYMLKRYLEHKYKNLNLALKKFKSLLVLLNSLDATIEKSKVIFETVNVTIFDELLRELWGFI